MTDEPAKVDLDTPDLAADKRALFESMFPGVLADGVIDPERLGALLDVPVAQVADGRERYGLMWAGKQDAVRSLLTPSRGTLLPDHENSVDFDRAENVFIEGDNLEVLKLLQKAYNDKVKLIYIDPPYNTGSNDFIYPDDFSDTLRAYLEYTGQVDAEGRRLSANADTIGRRHSRWLSMMYPRLVLARNLLTQDGVIFVSIDDNEVANLKSVLDEVFGPENFLNTFVWVSNLKGRQISGSGAVGTKEYLHVYARNAEEAGAFRASASLLKSAMPSAYKGLNYEALADEHGPYVVKNELYNTNSAFNEETRPNLVYDIYYHPGTREVRTAPVSAEHVHEGFAKIAPKRNNNGIHRYHAFRWGQPKVLAESHNLEFVETSSGWKVYTKVRDVDSTAVKDIFLDVSTSDGSRGLADLGINPAWFDYPKPVKILQILVAFATDRDSLVMDFFAGSGATAHAVALQNGSDGGSRSTISVNLPEPLPQDSEARKAGLRTVSDVTRVRLRVLAEQLTANKNSGLAAYRLGASNFLESLPQSANTLLDLSETTLLGSPDWDAIVAEMLLKEGVPLHTPWERHSVGGAEIVTADGVAVVLSAHIDQALASAALALKPRVVVFLEDGFAGADAVKANAFTNAKNANITMKTV